MKTLKGIRRGTQLKKAVLGPHPIIQTFINRLKIDEIIRSYIKEDFRLLLGIEQTLCVLIHNILTTPMPMYEISDWLAPIDEKCL